MSGTTRIKGADWVIAWDAAAEAFPLSLPIGGSS